MGGDGVLRGDTSWGVSLFWLVLELVAKGWASHRPLSCKGWALLSQIAHFWGVSCCLCLQLSLVSPLFSFPLSLFLLLSIPPALHLSPQQ